MANIVRLNFLFEIYFIFFCTSSKLSLLSKGKPHNTESFFQLAIAKITIRPIKPGMNKARYFADIEQNRDFYEKGK